MGILKPDGRYLKCTSGEKNPKKGSGTNEDFGVSKKRQLSRIWDYQDMAGSVGQDPCMENL